jgi:hypothetical protein
VFASRPAPPKAPTLPYRKPQLGRDYWVADDFLPHAEEISARCLAKTDWELGYPRKQEYWPGMRAANALRPDELAWVETWVKQQTGAKKLWEEIAPDGAKLNHNCVQLVGGDESGPRPHTDSKKLCRYAAVIYLSPKPKPKSGTSFFRLRYPDGKLGGNLCPPPHANLRDALGLAKMPLEAWKEELAVENVFNRIILYRSDLVHSATGYFGREHQEKRMTALFFWMGS